MTIVCRKIFIVPAIVMAIFALALYDYWSLDFDADVLKGKRVVVTGASRGIGKEVALHYASRGAHVLLSARNEELLSDVRAECERLARFPHQTFHYLVADQGSEVEAERLIQKAEQLLGGIDILFLNHAISTLGFWKGTSENITSASSAVRINYLANVFLASAAQSHLIKSKGSLVVVSSATSVWAMPSVAHYGASKAAINSFFKSLDLEFRLSNVDVSVTICVLGLIKTQRYLENMSAFNPNGSSSIAFSLGAEPSDAALFMIKAAALRKREVRFPFSQFFLGEIMDWMPMPLKLRAMKRTLPMISDNL